MSRSSPRTRVVGSLIVLVALLLAFTVLTVSTMSYEGGDDTKTHKAQLGCTGISQAIEAYTENPDNPKHELPRTLNDLVQPPFGVRSFLRNGAQDLLDPWGNPYQMQVKKRPDGTDYIFVFTSDPHGTPISQLGIGPNAEPRY